MKKAVLLVMLVLALFATVSVSANQAQPVAVITELAVDLSPPMIAIETDCLSLNLEQSTHIGKILNDTNNLLDMTSQNANTFNDETTAGTRRLWRQGIFAVNIGFVPHLQIT